MSSAWTGTGIRLQATASFYDELRDFDPAQDLEDRTLRVTAEGVRWEAAQRGSLSRAQLLELHYYLVLTRALDREIVKLSRKGLAFGKHLLSTGPARAAGGGPLEAAHLPTTERVIGAIRELLIY